MKPVMNFLFFPPKFTLLGNEYNMSLKNESLICIIKWRDN